VECNSFLFCGFQVHHLLKDVDPSFIKEFVSRIDALFLNCFLVTPNCHRVTELVHPFSNGQKLIFVGGFSSSLLLVLFIISVTLIFSCFIIG